jgi:hypothetical protein
VGSQFRNGVGVVPKFRRVSGGALAAWLLIAGAGVAAEKAPLRVGREIRHGVSAPFTERVQRPVSRQDRKTSAPSAPGLVLQFDGANANDNLAFYKDVFPPPDPSGAAGPNHYFQAINLVYRIFDEDGNTVLGPLPTASLWSGLGGICETGTVRTPLIRFDALAARWVVVQSGFDFSDATVHACFAVSQTPDPTGAYNLYDFVLANGSIATSSRIGVWPDGYYLTVNQVSGFADAGIGIYAFDRAAMLDGDEAGFVYANAGAAQPETLWGLPSDLEGIQPPPDGSPNLLAALGHPGIDGAPAPVLHTWRFHVDFADPESSTLEGPVEVPLQDFTPLDCGTPTEGCVPQLDSTQLLQASPNRLMYRMPYRHFQDRDSLVATFTVDAGEGQAAVRWLELRNPFDTPVVFQQNTFAPDATHRFVGSVAMDRVGNIALGYNRSDTTMHPGLGVTGRLVLDPPGHMGSEDAFFEGPHSQPPVVGLWGNYSSMSIDPENDCRFWFTAEYIGEPAPFFEYTRIGAFQFPSCSDSLTGTLEGTVTEADSGTPISGVKITAGPSETVTDGVGHYQILLPIGTYDVTASKFGLISGVATGVEILADQTTTQDFALGLAPHVLLNGVVKDGSGAGWPLYAKIRVTGPPEFPPAELFSDPVTGYYGLTLVADVDYTLSTEAVVPGYEPDERTLHLSSSAAERPDGVVEIIELEIDTTTCKAPGYGLDADGLSERFNEGKLPPGWNVVNSGGGLGWTIHTGADPCGLFDGNLTGGVGAFALVNSHCEGEVSEDTELVTPSVDLSSLASVQIRFDQDFNGGFPAFGEIADVDVSIDGGTSWSNVLHQTVAAAGPNTQSVDITGLAAGESDVRARFHYYNAFAALWWQVDDVILGQTVCAAREGGLVVGQVFDANTGMGLNGALVTNAPGPSQTHSFSTGDPAHPDGLYVLFSESGAQTITAAQALYAGESKPATVVPNGAQRVDFHLDAGSFTASPRPISVRVDPGGSEVRTLTLDNGGALAADFDIAELYVPPAPGEGLVHEGSSEAGNVVNAYPTGLDAPWGIAFDADSGDLWISNSALFAGDDREYRFLTDGTNTGETIDDSSWIADFAADGAYNPRTEKIWRVNVGGDNCIHEIDPVSRTVSGNRICPSFGTSQRGLAYDPVTDSYYSGSWTDGVVHHFDAEGALLDSAYVGIAVSGLAFDSSNGRLYALANHDVLLGFDVYVLDTRNHYAVLGAFFVTSGGTPVLSPNGGAGMEIDCNGHLWLIDSVSKTLYEVETGTSGACGFLDIPWLTENPEGATVAPHTGQPVVCTFDAAGLSPGLRQGILRIHTNTPYSVPSVPVSLTVRFLDVTDGDLFDPSIYAAAGAGVMPGCDPAAFLFCPTDLVTRADMAGFILRGVHGAGFVPAPYAGAFADVAAGDFNADYIQSFLDEGYTVGCGGGNYCPDAVHTRSQTAVFILKGIHGTDYVPPACGTTHVFDDVPCPPTPEAPFGDWIGQLSVEGITAGCGGNNFCPSAGIPNQQMAAFLVKAFGLPHL